MGQSEEAKAEPRTRGGAEEADSEAEAEAEAEAEEAEAEAEAEAAVAGSGAAGTRTGAAAAGTGASAAGTGASRRRDVGLAPVSNLSGAGGGLRLLSRSGGLLGASTAAPFSSPEMRRGGPRVGGLIGATPAASFLLRLPEAQWRELPALVTEAEGRHAQMMRVLELYRPWFLYELAEARSADDARHASSLLCAVLADVARRFSPHLQDWRRAAAGPTAGSETNVSSARRGS